MNPEEETEAAHFELWESELPVPTWTHEEVMAFGLLIGGSAQYVAETSQPSVWVRLGEMVAFLSVWAVILGVGIAIWVAVIALILWLIP